MRSSDAMFGAAALFLGVTLYLFLTFSPGASPSTQTLHHVQLITSLLVTLCVYLAVVGLIVAIRWSSRRASKESEQHPASSDSN